MNSCSILLHTSKDSSSSISSLNEIASISGIALPYRALTTHFINSGSQPVAPFGSSDQHHLRCYPVIQLTISHLSFMMHDMWTIEQSTNHAKTDPTSPSQIHYMRTSNNRLPWLTWEDLWFLSSCVLQPQKVLPHITIHSHSSQVVPSYLLPLELRLFPPFMQKDQQLIGLQTAHQDAKSSSFYQ